MIDFINSQKGWFCAMPFYHIYSNSNGKWAPCCLAEESDKQIDTTTIKEWWNSDTINELRTEMVYGASTDCINKFCSVCKNQEAIEGHSFRTEHNDRFNRFNEDSRGLYNAINEFKDTSTIDLDYIDERFLELKLRLFGNKCNLTCFMCFPRDSNKRVKEVSTLDVELQRDFKYDLIKDVEVPLDDLINQILEIASNVSYIKIIGGEPLMLKEHSKLLDALISSGHSKYITLKYQTNLSLQHNLTKYVNDFRHIHVSISLDSTKEYNDYLRYGSDWNVIDNNIRELKQHKISISVSATVTFLSILRYNDLIKYTKDWNIYLDYFILNTPDFLSIQHLPNKIKDRLMVEFRYYDDIYNVLDQPRDEDKFQKALKYCIELDRKQNLFDLFPELKEYYVDNSSRPIN